jgi:hypothetical protein
MPISWTTDSHRQPAVVTAEGDVTHADADTCLGAVEGSGALASADRPIKLLPACRWHSAGSAAWHRCK